MIYVLAEFLRIEWIIETEKITLEKISVMYELREQNGYILISKHIFNFRNYRKPCKFYTAIVKEVLDEMKKVPTQQPHAVELGL